MKEHLDKLEKSIAECREVHEDAEEYLHGYEHEDAAIVHMWHVLSHLTKVVCAQAELDHHYHKKQDLT